MAWLARTRCKSLSGHMQAACMRVAASDASRIGSILSMPGGTRLDDEELHSCNHEGDVDFTACAIASLHRGSIGPVGLILGSAPASQDDSDDIPDCAQSTALHQGTQQAAHRCLLAQAAQQSTPSV